MLNCAILVFVFSITVSGQGVGQYCSNYYNGEVKDNVYACCDVILDMCLSANCPTGNCDLTLARDDDESCASYYNLGCHISCLPGCISISSCSTKPANAYYTGSGGNTNSCPWVCNVGFERTGDTCSIITTTTLAPTTSTPRPTTTTTPPPTTTPFLCPMGNYTSPIGCLPCPHGTFSSVPGVTRCESCPSGKYADATGTTTCSNCNATACTADQSLMGCGNFSAGTCVTC